MRTQNIAEENNLELFHIRESKIGARVLGASMKLTFKIVFFKSHSPYKAHAFYSNDRALRPKLFINIHAKSCAYAAYM